MRNSLLYTAGLGLVENLGFYANFRENKEIDIPEIQKLKKWYCWNRNSLLNTALPLVCRKTVFFAPF